MDKTGLDQAILRFFRDDLGGILITDEAGDILYEDEKTSFIRTEKTNWKAACPAPHPEQKAEYWDLVRSDSGKTYMVITSTFSDEGGMKQIHHLVNTSLYTNLFRDVTAYSRTLQAEKEHDWMTGLFNKGKFMEMKRSLFCKQDTIAVFNMDLNNLKLTNDSLGHEAGDRLIKKAAMSLRMIEARNIIPFRVGGDEFIVVALHVDRQGAEWVRKRWENALEKLNREDDSLPCVIACGFAFGEKGFDLDELLALADERMYEDKLEKKRKAGQPLSR